MPRHDDVPRRHGQGGGWLWPPPPCPVLGLVAGAYGDRRDRKTTTSRPSRIIHSPIIGSSPGQISVVTWDGLKRFAGKERWEMKASVEIWDAFTDVPFTGNVAGVVLDASDLTPEDMQRIAAELNAPTTGFVVGHEPGPPPVFEVRYFTPQREIALCGHVTVALFTALATSGHCRPLPEGTTAYQRTAVGLLPVTLFPTSLGRVTVQMEQRLPQFESPCAKTEEVQEVLGGVELDGRLAPEIVSTGLRHLLVPLPEPEDLARLQPDFVRLRRLSHFLGTDTVCAFAVGPRSRWVRARDFCPAIGADEEPASGTTSGALTSYLVKNGVVTPDRSGQVMLTVEQGVEMGRPSRIEVGVSLAQGAIARVWVRGQAVPVLHGEFTLARSTTFLP